LIDNNSDFSSTFKDSSLIVGSSASFSGFATNTTYYWKIRATSVAGSSAYTVAYSFITIYPLIEIGTGSAAATTVTIPAGHKSGDLMVIFAFRDGSTTPPSLPSGWTNINSAGANICSAQLGWAIATSTSEVSGTWTNASELVVFVFRTYNGQFIAPGAFATATGSSVTVNYPALTMGVTNGTSWVIGVAGHRTATDMEQAPTGMTNRQAVGTETSGHDTNGPVASWSSQNVTVNANSGWMSYVLEIIDQQTKSQVATDDFTYSDGNNLPTPPWTTVTSMGRPNITSNQYRTVAVGTDCAAYYDATFSNAQYGTVKVNTANTDGGKTVCVLLQVSTSAQTFYRFGVAGPLGASAVMLVRKCVAGTYTTVIGPLTTTVNSGNASEARGYVGIQLFFLDGILKLIGYDTALTSGKVGIMVFNDAGGTFDDALGDNFRAGDMTTP